MCSVKEAALDITLYFLKSMKQDKLADTLKDELVFINQRQLKSNLKKKYQCVFEGIAKHGDSTLLNSIYTDLYITQGCSEQVNYEHEIRKIEVAARRHETQEIQVECTNLFEAPEQDEIRTVLTKGVAGIGKSVSVQKFVLFKAPEQDKKIRTVLAKGVAGIGTSVSVQKFVLDWAEGKENQDISFIFPLPFREINLKEKKKQGLMSLVSQFFPETKGLNLTRRNQFKVLFILDGLDECRLPLNFDGNDTWCDVSSPASLDVLLTNLIKGNLLPSALIWITTRPAAASKIPPDCIDRVTEVRGFNDAQKEEYFKKRFTDQNQAKEIIDHVKQSKSLFIMCHIPVFCWISATVLQNILEEKRNNDQKNNQAGDASKTLQISNTEDIPKTLTQMYTHFLRFQIQQSRRKYDGEYTPDVSWDKDAILSLGKLAFQQLEKNNLIFYESDLEACGIDVSKASVYSSMCTQIFKEETGIILGTMYCFVHMSIQEFIAALYAPKSLFIMCHIPVFCWISATVLQNILEEKRNNDQKNNQAGDASKTLQISNTEDIPKTLTQMYTHFLHFQIQQSRRKYDGEYTPDVSWDKDAILSLGKLAFQQLEKNNLIFYESDLEACGIDVSKASVYSSMCTQIFKEETGIILGTMYCFVHMSIQEFIAALYAHLFLDKNKKNTFVQESTEHENQNDTMIDLLKTAVDKALESETGHLDLFLRFLLGLSLKSKKTLLRGLLTQQDGSDQSTKEIVQYIKQKLEANLSSERSINLFYCLNELNDQTLVNEIQTQLREGSLSSAELSPAQWSAVAFVLLTSEKEMEEFELQKFKKSDECLIRLSPVIKTSKKALLVICHILHSS
ncbi:protein NLRC3-like [Sinocyclocheilus anshuiensis]|uniref:protein NLRC3-like n=1 Tax=Sinocyclocheilus anshuiensis TaxID=1608454 RepID=UPI0007B8862D|nr:PREDICTED: protein NLRC3-like [Sinocyclocheilus anshuiensis]